MSTVLQFPSFQQHQEPHSEAVQPQVAKMEDGFTRTPNELLDALAFHDFTKRQHKVLRVVERKTLGHSKRMDWISGSQFQQMSNLAENKARETVAELVRAKVLIKEGRKIGFNMNIGEWDLKQPQNGVNNPKAGLKNNPKLGCEPPPKRGDTKETLQKKEDKPSLSETADAASRLDDAEQLDQSSEKTRPNAAVQTPNGKKWGTADDLLIARHMADTVAQHQGAECSALTDQELVGWADDIRRLRGMKTSSGRVIEPQHIRALWDYAHQDSFWKTNLLSPSALRKHWERLAIKRREDLKQKSSGAHHAASKSGSSGYVMGAQEAAIARGEQPKAPPGFTPYAQRPIAPASQGAIYEHGE